MAGTSSVDGDAHTSADTETEFEATTEGETLQFSTSETLVPVTNPGPVFDELTSREFMQLQEQLWRYEADLRRRPKQHAVATYRGEFPVPFRVGNVPEPEFMQEETFPIDGEILRQVPWAARVELIEDEARERDADFRARLPKPKAPTRTPPHLLPKPHEQIVVHLDVTKPDNASVRVRRTRTRSTRNRKEQ